MDYKTRQEVDALIDAAGGPTELARRMGFDKRSGRQRVSNWREAGIPPMVVKAYKPFFKRLMAKVSE
jgi:hypothetical protein